MRQAQPFDTSFTGEQAMSNGELSVCGRAPAAFHCAQSRRAWVPFMIDGHSASRADLDRPGPGYTSATAVIAIHTNWTASTSWINPCTWYEQPHQSVELHEAAEHNRQNIKDLWQKWRLEQHYAKAEENSGGDEKQVPALQGNRQLRVLQRPRPARQSLYPEIARGFYEAHHQDAGASEWRNLGCRTAGFLAEIDYGQVEQFV